MFLTDVSYMSLSIEYIIVSLGKILHSVSIFSTLLLLNIRNWRLYIFINEELAHLISSICCCHWKSVLSEIGIRFIYESVKMISVCMYIVEQLYERKKKTKQNLCLLVEDDHEFVYFFSCWSSSCSDSECSCRGELKTESLTWISIVWKHLPWSGSWSACWTRSWTKFQDQFKNEVEYKSDRFTYDDRYDHCQHCCYVIDLLNVDEMLNEIVI